MRPSLARKFAVIAPTLAAAFFSAQAAATAKSTPTSKPQVVYAFTGGADGATPNTGLVIDAKGNAFGTTQAGGKFGKDGDGVVFKVAASGKETILYNFGSTSSAGITPVQGLAVDEKGNLFGATHTGGSNKTGTVFECTPSGTTFKCDTIFNNPKTLGPITGYALNSAAGKTTIGYITEDVSSKTHSQIAAIVAFGNSWKGASIEKLPHGLSFNSIVAYTKGSFFSTTTAPANGANVGEAFLSTPTVSAATASWKTARAGTFTPYQGYPTTSQAVMSDGTIYVPAELGGLGNGALDKLTPTSSATFRIASLCSLPAQYLGIVGGPLLDGANNAYLVVGSPAQNYTLTKFALSGAKQSECPITPLYNFGGKGFNYLTNKMPELSMIVGRDIWGVETSGHGSIFKFSDLAAPATLPQAARHSLQQAAQTYRPQ